MVDAVKILGSLLSSGVLSKGSGSQVLGTILSSALGGNNSRGGNGDMLGSLIGAVLASRGGNTAQSGGGLGNLGGLLGGLLGGGQTQQPQTRAGGGGMADVLGGLLGAATGGQNRQAQPNAGAGGLGDLLGGLLGAGAAGQQTNHRQAVPNNPMGDLLGSLLGGGNNAGAGAAATGGLGALLGGAVSKYLQTQAPNAPDVASQYLPDAQAQQAADSQARILITAMINAAKADGKIDAQEQANILSRLEGLSQADIDFIHQQMAAPLNVLAFVRSVPQGMEQQVYLMSLMAIDLDTQAETEYLRELAQAFALSNDVRNQLHTQVGLPPLHA